MVSAVASSPNVFAPPQTQSQSNSSSQNVSFAQAVDQYTQDTTSGVGSSSSAANPSQTLSSDLMSTLMQMQS
jgi:hypothetical protein